MTTEREQGQIVSINDVLMPLLRLCAQYFERDEELQAKVTYGNVVHLAMVYGCSDDVVRLIFQTAFQLTGPHPELAYFGKRATHPELAQLKRHQDADDDARRAIRKASSPDSKGSGIPPLYP